MIEYPISPIKILLCYAYKDESTVDSFAMQLIALKKQRPIEIWPEPSSRRSRVDPKAWIEQEIFKYLNLADIILVFFSPDFMASSWYDEFVKKAIDRHQFDKVRVVPIILRPVRWQDTPLGRLRSLPGHDKTATDKDWDTQDHAFYNIEEGIRPIVEELLADIEKTIGSHLEQLWYTWSTIGLDRINVGFRVRAASRGLSDLRSERIQYLDKYLRYQLPQGANPFVDPIRSPVCLTLVNTGYERALIYKTYIGSDGNRRPGNFFAHVLAGLPGNFSAKDAISLWGSPDLKSSDSQHPSNSVKLDPINPINLRKKLPFDSAVIFAMSAEIAKHLPFVIHAYLLTKGSASQKASYKGPIFIAADDNLVAGLIYGLTCSLPTNLIKGLTFSTYENDIRRSKMDIVGTCWLSGGGKNNDTERLLPASYFQDCLAINCYTGQKTTLPSISREAHFANFAAKCIFSSEGWSMKDLKGVLQEADIYPDLDVETFLNLYQALPLKEKQPNEEAIKFIIELGASHPGDRLIQSLFLRTEYKEAFTHLLEKEPSWWQNTGRSAIADFRRRGPVHDSFSQIVPSYFPKLIEALARVREEDPRDYLSWMLELAPPRAESEVWIGLLKYFSGMRDWELRSIWSTEANWEVYSRLIRLYRELYQDKQWGYPQTIDPLLKLPWSRIEDFRSLDLPMSWKVRVAENFLTSPLSPADEGELPRLLPLLTELLSSQDVSEQQIRRIGALWMDQLLRMQSSMEPEPPTEQIKYVLNKGMINSIALIGGKHRNMLNINDFTLKELIQIIYAFSFYQAYKINNHMGIALIAREIKKLRRWDWDYPLLSFTKHEESIIAESSHEW